MNSIGMTTKRQKPVPLVASSGEPSRSAPARPRRGQGAFDVWLQRGLHKLFDDVASEPIPDDLLRLIEDDREAQ